MSSAQKNKELEERLIDYAVRVIRIVESLPKTRAGNHIAGQLIRSGTSPAPNYGEAMSAESRSDFIHKMNISLKELRETRVWLRVITRADIIKPALVEPLLNETEQLIAIFVASIKTARQNRRKSG